MVAEPDEAHAEAFRMLRTNFEFVNQARRTRLVMVTSAHQGEGKSTTVANLAVALARSRWRVVLVDLDLRRPLLDRFFELEGRPGLTHVVLGHADLEEALVPVAVTEAGREVGTYAARDDDESAPASLDEVLTIRSGTRSARQAISPRMNGRGPAAVEGVLEVLPSGPIPPNPGEFVTVDALNGILESLRERSDLVLVDAPPLLHVGDALTLSAKVDALLLVTRMNVLRRPGLRELERILAGSPVPALGFIATGAQLDESYEYGYVAYSERASRRIEVEEELPV